MIIPAICNNCGEIFPSGNTAENCFSITMSNNQSGPCPKCGGMGHLPDGTFNFVNNTIELLQGPSNTISELKRIEKKLKEAKEKSAEVEDIRKIFLDEKSEIRAIADFLPKNRVDLYAFINIILATIAIIISILSSQKSCIQKINANTVINSIYLINKTN